MKTQINALPKYWVVECKTNDPDWKKVIDYLKNVYGEVWQGCNNGNYYGYDGNHRFKGTDTFRSIKSFKNNPTVLTIKQFVEITKRFVLPEKWCVQIHYDNSHILDKWRKNQPDYKELGLLDFSGLLLSDKHDGSYTYWGSPENYTEITFEQFKKYVMKEKNEIPEYVECINNKGCEDYGIIGRIYKFKNVSGSHWGVNCNINCGSYEPKNTLYFYPKQFKPSTKKAFDKQNSKKETMRTITYTQAQEIIDIACTTWKDKLFEKWGKSIVLRKSIVITELEYQEMRKACTSDQNELFDTIFGKDVKYKVGDWITYEGSSGYLGTTNQIKSFTDDGGALDENGHFRDLKRGYRLATEEEIQKAQYIPKGTPCLVRDANNDMWKFVYSLGNGKFQSLSGVELTWDQVQVLDMDNLPKY